MGDRATVNNNASNSVIVAFHGTWTLARTVAARLGMPCMQIYLSTYTDGEVKLRCPDFSSLKGRNVFLFPPPSITASESFFALSFVAQLLKQVGVRRLVGIVPYLPFSRQERSIFPGVVAGGPFYLIISYFKMVGINAIITLWLHSPEAVGLASLNIIDLSAAPLIANSIRENGLNIPNTWLIAPDRGALERVKQVAHLLNMPYLVFEKKRDEEGEIASFHMLAPALEAGAHAIIIDDIIATGSTALRACRELNRHGFIKTYGWFVHPVFAPGVGLQLGRSGFAKIFITNSLKLTLTESQSEKLKVEVCDISDLIVSGIKNNFEDRGSRFG